MLFLQSQSSGLPFRLLSANLLLHILSKPVGFCKLLRPQEFFLQLTLFIWTQAEFRKNRSSWSRLFLASRAFGWILNSSRFQFIVFRCIVDLSLHSATGPFSPCCACEVVSQVQCHFPKTAARLCFPLRMCHPIARLFVSGEFERRPRCQFLATLVRLRIGVSGTS